LRTFDAAARHQSLAKASQELNLTDSAVSHQLRRLEAALGVDLFEKAGRGVALTDAGRVFARSVAAALHDIARTAHSLADAAQVGGRLTIACPPMFASKWLAKNIAAFCYDQPAIECQIQLADNDRVVDVPDADLGIQFGSGSWPAKWSTLLETVAIAPACSPLLFRRAGHAFTRPSDLRDIILLHQDDGAEWRRWLAAEGDHAFDAYRRHLYCSDLSIAIDLAAEGAGVVPGQRYPVGLAYRGRLAAASLCRDHSGDRRLVCALRRLQARAFEHPALPALAARALRQGADTPFRRGGRRERTGLIFQIFAWDRP
jgi:LysR family transcriptional regulator, glycine cleavage system transcriptional activator